MAAESIGASLAAAVERAVGWRPVAAFPVVGGAIRVARMLVEGPDGSMAFVKHGVDEMAHWVAAELATYESAGVGGLIPLLLGVDRAENACTLVIEALNHARWPPPVSASDVLALRRSLDRIAALPTDGFDATDEAAVWPTWLDALERAPGSGVVDADWLEAHASDLAALGATAELGGDARIHGDAHTGNVCFRGTEPCWVDWSESQRANPEYDTALLAVSLRADSSPTWGPLSPGELALVARFAAPWAARASGPSRF